VSDFTIQKLQAQARHCDLMWCAIASDKPHQMNGIPSHIGILTVSGSVIKVLRQAHRAAPSEVSTGELAKLLLLQTIKR
jgi:hypothetical protein